MGMTREERRIYNQNWRTQNPDKQSIYSRRYRSKSSSKTRRNAHLKLKRARRTGAERAVDSVKRKGQKRSEEARLNNNIKTLARYHDLAGEEKERDRMQKLNWKQQNRKRIRETERVRVARVRIEKPNHFREQHLKRKFGITFKQWEAMFEAQGRCCAFCKSTDPHYKYGWHTDHCHTREEKHVRWILCRPCNLILSLCRENMDHLRAVIAGVEAGG